MKTGVQAGKVVTLAAPYSVAPGDGMLVGAMFGVASSSAASGAEVEVLTEGVVRLTAPSTVTGALGAEVYWDTANRRATTVSPGNALIGYLTAPKLNGETTALVRLGVFGSGAILRAAPDALGNMVVAGPGGVLPSGFPLQQAGAFSMFSPSGTAPAVVVDFERGWFYWGGAQRALTDLTATTGGYYIDASLGISGPLTAVVEYSTTAANGEWAGTMFSFTSGYPGGSRFEVTNETTPTFGQGARLYIKPATPADAFQSIENNSITGEVQSRTLRAARYRVAYSLNVGSPILRAFGGSQVRNSGSTSPSAIAAPTRVAFGCRAWAPSLPDDPASGVTLHRVVIYNEYSTAANVGALAVAAEKPPVHLLGDSFLNQYTVMNGIEQLASARGKFLAVSQDGVGSTSALQQSVRFFQQEQRWRNSTLVWCEMGLDGTWAQWLAAAEAVKAMLTHDRYLIVEPAPQEALGTPGRTAMDAFVSQMREWAGPRWVPTLAPAMALSTGSAQDQAKVSTGRWPTSITVSDVDFHPNTVGAAMMAGEIYKKLRAMAWA